MSENLTEKNINVLKKHIEKSFKDFKSVKEIKMEKNGHMIDVIFLIDQINLVMDVLSGRSFIDTVDKMKKLNIDDLSPDFPSGVINTKFKFRDFSTEEAVLVN